MSVILECQPGDEFVCIQEFDACPEGNGFSWTQNRHFVLGERLRYVSFRQSPNLKDHPSGWLIVFEASDGNRYAAAQTYFVTQECWQGLERHFTGANNRSPIVA